MLLKMVSLSFKHSMKNITGKGKDNPGVEAIING